jgi:K+-transporting ATPase c subunit
MRFLRTSLFIGILTLLLVSQTGCLLLLAAAGTGTGVAYVKGKTVNTVDGNPQQVAAATEKAFKDMSVTVVSNSASTIDSEVVGRTARDVKIDVVAKSRSEKMSEVFIRVGVFGDDPLQGQVLDRIKTNLASATTQPSSNTVTANAR